MSYFAPLDDNSETNSDTNSVFSCASSQSMPPSMTPSMPPSMPPSIQRFCRDGARCTKQTCAFVHGDTIPRIHRPCRYGDTCSLHSTGDCVYLHPGEQVGAVLHRADTAFARMERVITEKKARHQMNVARNAEIQARKAKLAAAGLPVNRAERRMQKAF